MLNGKRKETSTILYIASVPPVTHKNAPTKVSANFNGRRVLMYYTEYSFVALVDGKRMEFVNEEEYLEYISNE
jgi:hypothetical protein